MVPPFYANRAKVAPRARTARKAPSLTFLTLCDPALVTYVVVPFVLHKVLHECKHVHYSCQPNSFDKLMQQAPSVSRVSLDP